jgi:hypothetical protein
LERQRYAILPDGKTTSIKKSINISSIPHEYFQNCNQIDVHNHLRQGSLALERNIQTQNWVARLMSTFLGFILVDAYRMYLLDNNNNPENNDVLSFRDFIEVVGMSLVRNDFLTGRMAERGSGRKRNSEEAKLDEEIGIESPNDIGVHVLIPLKSHPNMKVKSKRVQLRCRICGLKCSFFCRLCSSETVKYPLCGPSAKRSKSCLQEHIDNIANIYM